VNTDSIFTAVEQLRVAAGDGPATRKALDALFRHVHNLKATASANGLNDLAAAAHEFETVLHSVRTRAADTFVSNAIPADVWTSLRPDQKSALTQSIAEGAKLFLVEASFEVAHFDREFKNLEQTLSKNGEVISRLPNASPGKVNFRILYAQRGEPDLPNTSDVTIQEISAALSSPPNATNDLAAVERALEKFSTELINLPAASDEGVLQQALRGGRAAAVVTGKDVEFEIRGEDLLLDKRCVAPLVHLVRNAVDHGIESSEERLELGKVVRGRIVIEAATLDGETRITVTDDGRGIDPALIHQIFNPGFSTAAEISEISGRGVGLDAVKTAIEEAGGAISVRSEVGQGSTFEIRIYPRESVA
jgi:two-component system, chemotaxis family, sensor kinase CheA